MTLAQIKKHIAVNSVERLDPEEYEAKYALDLKDGFIFCDGSHTMYCNTVAEMASELEDVQEEPKPENAIKRIRSLTGLSQAAFAKQYEIPARSIENWESGNRVPPEYVVKLLERVVKEDYKKG